MLVAMHSSDCRFRILVVICFMPLDICSPIRLLHRYRYVEINSIGGLAGINESTETGLMIVMIISVEF